MSDLPPFHLRRDLLGHGYSDAELRRRLRRGELARPTRGAYVVPASLPDAAAHTLRVRAAVAQLRPGAFPSHSAAAAAMGLDLWGVDLSRVEVTRDPPAYGHRSATLHCHVARLPVDDLVMVDGLLVTGPG